jgi:4-amino-4-deoxy-L-arabinose transferase-like glycosyltransferase
LTNSDEATMGLNALHIFTRGELPIFLYGQNYMGTLEAYLGARFFLLFGPSTFALRLGLVIMYAGFLLVLYLLACLLYTKGVALAALFLLCWGSNDTLFGQLMATGRVETWLFATLLLLLTNWLALSFHPDISAREQSPERTRRKRFLAYGCIGSVISLGLWSDLLILPFVCISLLLLLLFCHRELLTRAILFGILGFLIGSIPLLVFNIQHFSDNSVVTLWKSYSVGGTPLNLRLAILGAVLITIPLATGANPLCPLSSELGQWAHQLSK